MSMSSATHWPFLLIVRLRLLCRGVQPCGRPDGHTATHARCLQALGFQYLSRCELRDHRLALCECPVAPVEVQQGR